MFGHDAVADAESQAGAAGFPPGGEKGVEELAEVFGWNPGAIISKRNSDIAFRLLSFDAEFASLFCLYHSLLSVQNDVQENLLNLIKIDHYLGEAGDEVGYNFNIARFQFVSS